MKTLLRQEGHHTAHPCPSFSSEMPRGQRGSEPLAAAEQEEGAAASLEYLAVSTGRRGDGGVGGRGGGARGLEEGARRIQRGRPRGRCGDMKFGTVGFRLGASLKK